MLKELYRLTKPGIVYSNVMTAAAGFFVASNRSIRVGLLIELLLAIALIIASACTINNYIDRGIDNHMERTKTRAIPSGRVSGKIALIYGALLGILGFCILVLFTNVTTSVLGIIAYIDYIVIYGWGKRHTVYGTLIGTISGAIPPAAGYTAVSGHFNGVAIILFLILVFWQMPHFFAIAMYRLKDYEAAGLPVWPSKRGINSTKHQMLFYIVAFTIASITLTVFGITGRLFAGIAAALGALWIWRGVADYHINDILWAKRMFFVSLIVLLVMSVNLSLGARLP
ncbi:MAG TPA: heme o synthase [Candidatus Saccharimonadales bacterium]|nr:heme o synthase [Candidatus Saccharimonadales bacterium]